MSSAFELKPLKQRPSGRIVSVKNNVSKSCVSEDLPVWRGWDEYFSYWDGFVKEWFECKERNEDEGKTIKEASCVMPEDSLTKSLEKYFADGYTADDGQLDRKEIPEPYLGDPRSAKMVIIQMNPGASQDDEEGGINIEATKYFGNRHKEGSCGFLIKDFADPMTCNRLYSKWVERWSAAKLSYPPMKDVEGYPNGVPANMVCGHDGFWWQDARRRWIRNFAGAEVDSVFCIEMCPYHSRKFSRGCKVIKDIGSRHITERVLLPAAMAAQRSGVNCVISCGKSMDDFLSSMGAQTVEIWSRGVYRSGNIVKQIPEWPIKGDGTKKANWFKLYIFALDYIDQDSKRKHMRIPILSMYTNCMRMPAADFRVIEENEIKPRMRELGIDVSKIETDIQVHGDSSKSRIGLGSDAPFVKVLSHKYGIIPFTKHTSKEIVMEQDERKILKPFEIGGGYHMDKEGEFNGRPYVSCNTNSHARPGKIIYRASMNGNKIEIVLYTCRKWQETLHTLFNENSNEEWQWKEVDGLVNEDASGVVKLVNSVEEAKEALRYLYATFDKRLREEAPQDAKRTTVCTKATKPAKTHKRPAKLM